MIRAKFKENEVRPHLATLEKLEEGGSGIAKCIFCLAMPFKHLIEFLPLEMEARK